jgi:integrase
MASLRPRGSRWQARVTRAGSRTRYKTFDTREQAQDWAARMEDAAPKHRTLGAAISDHLDDPRRSICGERRRVLHWWVHRLGRKRLDRLKRADFFEARDALLRLPSRRGGTLAPATANWRLAVVSAVLTEEVLRDRLPSNPARIPRLTARNARDRILDPDELERLIAACAQSGEPALRRIVLAALATGCRAGELRRLRWRDIDLHAGLVRIWESKSGRPRSVALRGLALQAVRDTSADQAADDHVFAHRDGRVPFDYRESWEDARRRARLPGLRFHDLRHCHASALAESGANLLQIQAALGHSDPRMTARYAHLVESGLQDLGDRAASRLFGATEGGTRDR